MDEEESKHLYDKAGKGRKGGSWVNQATTESDNGSIGMNARSVVSVVLVLMLLMFVVHCTYVTSNAYSHPSVVLQSHTSDGLVFLFLPFLFSFHFWFPIKHIKPVPVTMWQFKL